MKIFNITVFFIISFLQAALCVVSSFAMVGDGGTRAACYPGGLSQVLAGVKPFIVPCAQYTPLGFCFHKGQPWAKLVMYWLPRYAIEVTGQGGTTIFPDASFMQSLAGTVADAGSMVQGEAANDTQTKYRQAHIYVFSEAELVEMLAGHPALACMLVGGNNLFGKTVFRSEDSDVWRTCKDLSGPSDAFTRVGAWGPLFPRCGWANHPSNVTASLLYAYRAQDLASGITGGFSVHSGNVLLDRYEIGGPIPGMCYPIGTPSIRQERLANRPGCADRFIIIYWQFMVKCCAAL